MLRILLVIVSVTGLCATAHVQTLGLNEGDVCRQDGETLWTCKHHSKCTHMANDVKAGKKPRPCTFDGMDPIVCCEPEVKAEPTRGAIARTKCVEYAKSVFVKVEDPFEDTYEKDTCHVDYPFLIDRQTTEPKEYPHMALVGYGSKKNIQWVCGGSLVSERFVLSAARCLRTANIRDPTKWVRLGEYNLATDQDDKDGNARAKDFEIIDVIIHPEYKEPSLYYDIALYKLDRDVRFNEFIHPICLLTKHCFPKTYAMVTGWGQTESGRWSNLPQKANVTLTGTKECSEAYKKFGLDVIKNGIDDKTQLCTENFTSEDTCKGTHGGGLVQRLKTPNCMYSLVGVTSFQYTCGGVTPSVYTRVSHFVPWIERVVWPNVTL